MFYLYWRIPRWKDEDWLYFDDDPFAPPPVNHDYVDDINSGDAYRESYKQLITDPEHKILVCILLYIDGAVTGRFDDLSSANLSLQ